MAKISIYFIIFIYQTIVCYGDINEQPDWLKTCQLADPEFVKCSTESIQGMFTKLASGIDGLGDFHTVDPLKIKQIKILQGEGPVSINATLSKVTVTGFGKTKIVSSKVSKRNFSWETTLFLPKLRIEGNYNMNGRILIIPLTGNGKCWLEPSNMNIVAYTKTKLYEKNGHVFYNVTSTKVDYTITGLRLNFDNLFDGIKALEDSTNNYLNENWSTAADALKPIITRTIEDIYLDVLQTIFHQIPGDFFVSDLPRSPK